MARRARLDAAVAAHRRGDLARAEEGYRKRLRECPDDPDALHLLGCIELNRQNQDKAVELMSRAIRLMPTVPLYHENLAEAWHRMHQPEKAMASCRLALRLDAARPRSHNRLGVLAMERGDYETAVDSFSMALRLSPTDAEVLVNVASVMIRLGDYRSAISAAEAALQQAPRQPLAWNNLGLARRGLGQLAEADDAFRRAGTLPLARFNRGYLAMLAGNLEAGLPLLEARREVRPLGVGLSGREWDGRQEPAGRLLVLLEQGMGDVILMSRFFPELLRQFDSVVVQVPPPLTRLISTLSPDLDVVNDLGGARWDFWCPLMSLPWRLGVNDLDRPAPKPWLHATKGRSGAGITPRGGLLRAGLNWAGNSRFAFDRVRSTSLDVLAPLLNIPGIEWVSLHKGEREDEAIRHGLPAPLACAVDFQDTADVMADLDLVVSTETAIPNLSAAMGIPTIVLAALDHDWRWHGWYPGVTVAAQEEPGEWGGALRATRERLESLVADNSGGSTRDAA